MHRIAVLDDYQSVAAGFTDWSTLPEPAEVVEFHDHLADEDAVADRLQPFDVVIAMRERTDFRRSLLERLPNLRLLVTTGRRNKSVDVEAATERGITVCGTGTVSPARSRCRSRWVSHARSASLRAPRRPTAS